MTKPIRFGVVGYGYGTADGNAWCGRGGGMFKMAVDGFDAIQPAAVCDINPAAVKLAGKTFPQIQGFTDFNKMLKTVKLDAMFIGTPATCHAEFSIKALQRNIHVLSEIPIVASVAEAKNLWRAHLRSKALYMTSANPNMWGFIETAVDLRRKGLLGAPYYIEAEYIHDIRGMFKSTPWRATYESIRYCTHSLGPILRLLDDDLAWTTCFDTGSHINRKSGQHDAMAALFRTRSNVVVRLLTSFVNNYPGVSAGHHYRIFTTKGAFERTSAYGPDRPEQTLFYSTDLYGDHQWTTLPSEYMRPEYAGNAKAAGHGGADYALLDRFFKAIRSGKPSPISLREGLRMTLPGIYAAESARRGGKLIRIKYPWEK